MKVPTLTCAIYARKSSEEGLEQGFNSLDAQREACAAFILSQKALGWVALPAAYDDGGFSGGNADRPALQRLMADIAAKRVKVVVVYKVDRLTRSLADFAKMVELFDAHGVSFVSVTQQFNTTSSMGRLTLNVLLSFAQFEREVTGERIRDKIAASKRKGMWMGGMPPIGYEAKDRSLAIIETQAAQVREIYRLYLDLNCVRRLKAEVDRLGWLTAERVSRRLNGSGGRAFSRGHLYRILSNPIYSGKIAHKDQVFDGNHPAIVDAGVWAEVQARMSANQQGHRVRANAAQPSLLTGLVFDEGGGRLTPSHAQKGSLRYRYYVGGRLPEARRDGAPKTLRVPAQELEEAVVGAMVGFLNDESQVLRCLGTVDGIATQDGLRRAKLLAQELKGNSLRLAQCIERITVAADKIVVRVKMSELGLDDSLSEDEAALIEVPMQLKRCGQAVRLIVHAPTTPSRSPDAKLITLLARAHDWFARLSSGSDEYVSTIAAEDGVSPSYVTRVIYLAFLAPDIVQRIVRGNHSPDLGTDRLMRMVPLPLDWAEQRILFGFAG